MADDQFVPDLEASGPQSRRPRRRSEWAVLLAGSVAVVAAAILAVVVLLNAVPAGSGEASPSSSAGLILSPGPSLSASASAVVSEAPHVSAEPSTSPPPEQFTQVATFPGASATALTSWPQGWVAVGQADSGPAVWLSADGATWETISPTGLDRSAINHLVAIPDGRLLAFGFRDDGSLGGSAAIWISADGFDWQAADIGLADLVNAQDVVAGPLGLVIVGIREGLSEGAVSNSALWYSADGVTWEQVWDTLEAETPAAVAAGPEGFVVVGQQGWHDGDPYGFALASADGHDWLEAPAEGAMASTGSMWSIVPIGVDWMAMPVPDRSEVRVLRSANGLDWSIDAPLPLDAAQLGHVAQLEGDGRFALFGAMGEALPMQVQLFVQDHGWQETAAQYSGRIGAASRGGITVMMVTSGEAEAPEVQFWIAATPS